MKRPFLFVIALVMNAMLISSAANAGNCALPPNAAQLVAKAGQLMNAQRASKGRKALRAEPRLQAAAMTHACDMATKGYFSHRGQDGSKAKRRVRRQNCRPGFVGENIAAGQTSPQELIQDWMKSPGHRKVMMIGRGVNNYGIGVAKAGKAYSHGYVWVLVAARGC